MNENSNSCSACREAIAAVASGDFSAEEFAFVEQHISNCSACREDYHALRALTGHITQPERGEDFNAFAESSARRAINAVRHLEHQDIPRRIFRLTAPLRAAAMIAVGFALGFSTLFFSQSNRSNGSTTVTPVVQTGERSDVAYTDFLERSHLLLLGAAVCKPECSEPDYAVLIHQRRISIELLLEAQKIRNLPNVRLRPQELRLIENIESALAQIAASGTQAGQQSMREESGAAVCEISQRLGM